MDINNEEKFRNFLLTHDQLECLDISGSYLSDSSFVELIKVLENNTVLKKLSLSIDLNQPVTSKCLKNDPSTGSNINHSLLLEMITVFENSPYLKKLMPLIDFNQPEISEYLKKYKSTSSSQLKILKSIECLTLKLYIRDKWTKSFLMYPVFLVGFHQIMNIIRLNHFIQSMKNLRYLDLQPPENILINFATPLISVYTLIAIKNLNIICLTLSNCNLNHENILHLTDAFFKMEKIDLSYNSLGDESLKIVFNSIDIKKIKSLNFEQTNKTWMFLECLAKFEKKIPNLVYLNVIDFKLNLFPDKIFQFLMGISVCMENLTHLFIIQFYKDIDESKILPVLRKFKNLQVLNRLKSVHNCLFDRKACGLKCILQNRLHNSPFDSTLIRRLRSRNKYDSFVVNEKINNSEILKYYREEANPNFDLKEINIDFNFFPTESNRFVSFL